MANVRLTVQSLSRNDISIIAKILEQSFDYYLHHNSPFFSDYLCSLRTLVGLGFAAVFADQSLLSNYQMYFSDFIKHTEGDFKQPRRIAQATAEMVGTAVISFATLKYPQYYWDFLQSLQYILTKIAKLTGPREGLALNEPSIIGIMTRTIEVDPIIMLMQDSF